MARVASGCGSVVVTKCYGATVPTLFPIWSRETDVVFNVLLIQGPPGICGSFTGSFLHTVLGLNLGVLQSCPLSPIWFHSTLNQVLRSILGHLSVSLSLCSLAFPALLFPDTLYYLAFLELYWWEHSRKRLKYDPPLHIPAEHSCGCHVNFTEGDLNAAGVCLS